jgi:phosphoribosylformimino-5-aminoimidazole carboxamide ribotide isomerase
MEVWAAIDLMDGAVVTLVKGNPSEKTSWGETPERFARRWENEGADGIHIVDLDAALGRGSNAAVVGRILREASIPVQVGGGIRSAKSAEEWFTAGADRVVLGTIAYREPRTLRRLLEQYGADRIVVAADYKDGKVMSRGWTESRDLEPLSAAREFEREGAKYLLATAVGRDGTGSGPDISTVSTLSSTTRLRVLASGGVRSQGDLVELGKAGAHAAIVGRAVYEGTLRLKETRSSY